MNTREHLNTSEQLKIIEKGCAELVGAEHLIARIDSGASLRVKFGMDPTAPDLHLGHAVVLRKLRQLQDLGHQAIIVLGDATACIGDPTGRSKTRKPLTHEEVLVNAATYKNQLFRVLDPDRTEIRFNAEWLYGISFPEVLKLMATTTVAQILERDDFKNRFSAQEAIGLHEFLYPLMQGYDSVALQADLELGGTDQRFNILMGRTLQRHYGQEAQASLFMPLLEGTDGVEKMSKSLGNHIGLFEHPDIIFEKIMKVPDTLIIRYFLLCTDEHPDRVAEWENKLAAGVNPRDVKMELASIVTGLYGGAAAAVHAKTRFGLVFREGGVPDEMPEIGLNEVRVEGTEEFDPLAILVLAGFAGTRGEARRLIRQGGVRLGEAALRSELPLRLSAGDILRCGKKGFVRIHA